MAPPSLSIIVPVHNSAAELVRCLDALTQSSTQDFHVLVVDDGSTQHLKPLVLSRSYDYMHIEGPLGPACARNRGAQRAVASVLVFIDADVCVHQDTLAGILAVFKSQPDLAAVVGTYDDAPAHPGFISQYKNLFHRFVHHQSAGIISTFWAGCGAIRRDVFLRFGGFDEQRYRKPAIEDIELGMRITTAGHQILLNDQIQCKHLKRWTFWSMLKTDILDRGIPWIRLMHRMHRLDNKLNVAWSQRISVLLVYLIVLSVPLAFWFPTICLIVLVLGSAVVLLNVAFYRFFNATRGPVFTLRVLPLHCLYFLYCGFCVVVGTVLRFVAPETSDTKPLTPISPDATSS